MLAPLLLRRLRRVLPLILALSLFAVPEAFAAKEKRLSLKKREALIATLPGDYQEWVRGVEVLISDEELRTFAGLSEDYQRDAFIRNFWKVRDSYPDTARNEFKDRWERRVVHAQQIFGELDGERSRIFLLNGEPAVRIEVDCGQLLWPTEIWYYAGTDRSGSEFFLVFTRRLGGKFRVWNPIEGLGALFQQVGLNTPQGALIDQIRNSCFQGDRAAGVLAALMQQGPNAYAMVLADAQEKPDPPEGEWVETFAAYSTDLPDGAATFDGTFEAGYPGRRQSRTVLQGAVVLPAEQASVVELSGRRSYNFLITGEVLAEGELFDSFRYKFELSPGEVRDGQVPLVFERYLRPGSYRLLVKVEDLNGERYFRVDQSLEVPTIEGAPPAPLDSATAQVLAEANALLSSGETSLRLIEPHGRLLTGLHRFETILTGSGVARVDFRLDGDPLYSKKKPPFSIELDLGDLPRPRRLQAIAVDAEGNELAADELLINARNDRFEVKLVEPPRGRNYSGSVRARAEVQVPEGKTLERVELFINENRVSTLYQEPYANTIVLPEGDPVAYLQAVAYLTDGNSTEDLLFVNAPDVQDEMSIEFVELYATVTDRQGRPVTGLAQDLFQVVEDGVAQQVRRFEQVGDRPIHATVLLDVSASMEGRLEAARDAALTFFEEILTPKDRASVVIFNDRPSLQVKFTAEVSDLAGGLAGLKAERGTALYDSLIFSLYDFIGVKGQRALLVLSDGKDESSRFEFEDALEYAQRAGVTIYAIGLDLPKGEARRKLGRFAETTGGRSFFLDSVAELPAVYQAIEEELRAQYLIAYQSSNTDPRSGFRKVELDVDQRGLTVQASQGYYP